MKKYIFISVFGAVILAMVAFAFYWMQVRPAQARTECRDKVRKEINKPGELLRYEVNDIYRACLTDKGQKPENMLDNNPRD